MCLGDFHNNIGYLKIKKFHAHTVSNDGSFVAVTVQIVCSLSYPHAQRDIYQLLFSKTSEGSAAKLMRIESKESDENENK